MSYAFLAVYLPRGSGDIIVLRIDRDQSFIKQMEDKINIFYKKYLEPIIAPGSNGYSTDSDEEETLPQIMCALKD